MKVFLDTNIVLDYVDDRGSFSDYAATIVQLAKQKEFELYASDLTFLNTAYVMRRYRDKVGIYTMLKDLRSFISVLGIGEVLLDKSIDMQHKDFEDCVQYNCAKSNKMDCIITRNTKDFDGLDIKVYSPTEFLDLMNVEY